MPYLSVKHLLFLVVYLRRNSVNKQPPVVFVKGDRGEIYMENIRLRQQLNDPYHDHDHESGHFTKVQMMPAAKMFFGHYFSKKSWRGGRGNICKM